MPRLPQVQVFNPEVPVTVEGYSNTADRLQSVFDAKQLLRRITVASAEQFVAQVTPMRETRPFSEWSRHRVYREARAMFEQAVKWGWIPRNPFEEIEAPSLELRDWQYLDADQDNVLVDTAP